jgi:A/G-specific adenine glycosylase
MPASVDGAAGPGQGEGSTFAQRVIDWQQHHGRHGLPWQGTRDPYRVWLSEVMLQQTQVGTVLGYYERFLARFADVAALAAAPLQDVLALWSGLGYYSRARNLHRCAQEVVARHGGRFPGDSATLQTLPGIGRSTAAAIAAFCFGEQVAILDGNVKRVLARALGFDGDLGERRQELALWACAEALLPERGIEPYTQGLMDLGAQVCTRSRPSCPACPLQALCIARAQGRPEAYPVRTRRMRRGARRSALLWLTHGDDIWLAQRPERGVWAGLWSLPEWPEPELPQHWPGQGVWLEPFVHVLTHLDWELQPLRWQLPEALVASERDRLTRTLGAGRWWGTAQALALGLPAPVRRLLSP